MRELDMRLIVFITLIVLSAAMPANCAEDPAFNASGCRVPRATPAAGADAWTAFQRP